MHYYLYMKCIIYVHGFWGGFLDKTDANHIGFFENLFSRCTKLKNYSFTQNIDEANVLFESVFSGSLSNTKLWQYKIQYSGEPKVYPYQNYSVVLFSDFTRNNIVDVPLFTYYIHNNNFLPALKNKPIITKVPPEFCCFIVSNGNAHQRNKMFDVLNNYKRVHSLGKFNNNVGGHIKADYWTEDYRNILRNFKFIICFENSKFGTYITEKIVNPYLAGIVPIYWGTNHVFNIFNKNSMIYLEDESNYENVLNKVIELDNDDTKYLEFVNRPFFNENYFNENYTIDKISEKLNNVLE